MSEATKTPNPFDLLLDQIRLIIRDEIRAATNGNNQQLLTPEELAEKLGLRKRKNGKEGKEEPLTSWVYEQSRLGNIPTHHIGRYIRFSLSEVLESQKKKNSP